MMHANKQTSVEQAIATWMVRYGFDARTWPYVDAKTIADIRLRHALRSARTPAPAPVLP